MQRNRDETIDFLREQYQEQLQEAFDESHHENGKSIDYELLEEIINKLFQAAYREGLPPGDFEELVSEILGDQASHIHLERPHQVA